MGRLPICRTAARGVALALTGLGLAGCMQTRYYPLCIYAGSNAFVANPRLYEDVAVYAQTLGGKNSTARASTNRRVIAVRASPSRHRNMRSRWPYAACIGPTDRAEHINNYRECVTMMERSFAERRLPPLQRNSDGVGGDNLNCLQGDSFSATDMHSRAVPRERPGRS